MGTDFDTPIERRGSNSAKWDLMETLYGVDPETGISMWVADMDLATAPVVTDALRAMADHRVFGYAASEAPYRDAICWWMRHRHGWDVDPQAIFTTDGLVNAVGMCLDVFTAPGNGVVLTTPVYHAFAKAIHRAGRRVVECQLALQDGIYQLDIEAWDRQMSGSETMLILCSPHNPGGRVWSRDDLRQIAAFAERHDLIVLSDEIHQDLTFPGARHLPFPVAAPEALDRTVVLNAPSKTFNIAGAHVGHVIIPDPALRARYHARALAISTAHSTIAMEMTRAAYSSAGAAWLDDLRAYLDGNRQIFDQAINAIPGLRSMPLEATYLAWVDTSGTGMTTDEVHQRVHKDAGIAANHGDTFGKGGETYLRFNLATTRARVSEAAARLTQAFDDLQ